MREKILALGILLLMNNLVVALDVDSAKQLITDNCLPRIIENEKQCNSRKCVFLEVFITPNTEKDQEYIVNQFYEPWVYMKNIGKKEIDTNVAMRISFPFTQSNSVESPFIMDLKDAHLLEGQEYLFSPSLVEEPGLGTSFRFWSPGTHTLDVALTDNEIEVFSCKEFSPLAYVRYTNKDYTNIPKVFDVITKTEFLWRNEIRKFNTNLENYNNNIFWLTIAIVLLALIPIVVNLQKFFKLQNNRLSLQMVFSDIEKLKRARSKSTIENIQNKLKLYTLEGITTKEEINSHLPNNKRIK